MKRIAPYLMITRLAAVMPLLTACTVGPDFQRPAPPQLSSYIKADANAADTSASLVAGLDIPADWWTLFRSDALDSLIKQAIKQNPNLQSAQAALRVAMENLKAQSAASYPTVTAGLGATHTRQSASLSPALAAPTLLYDLYQAQASFSWTPDIWGGNRRAVEALHAQADAQRYQFDATYVALVANVVAAAIQEASLREQINATQAIIQDESDILAIDRKQHDLGEISGQDVAAQETVLAQSQQTLVPLQRQLAQQRDLLTVLAGHYPAEDIEQTFASDSLAIPEQLPLSLPARLVEQRPDVRMAEENLHSASAQIGVAVAARLPNITLSANAGTVATQLGQLVGTGNEFWSLGAGLTQPIFDGGALAHREAAARATYDQMAAQYRGTVLFAFQNVADALHAIQSDDEAIRVAAVAEAAAARSLSIARTQLAMGQVARLALVNAEVAYQEARIASVMARTNQLSDAAALMQALGGGWWNNDDLKPH
jgi:NodT family efflux transporter outer membrane factor (OMF) lipoprotein